VRLSFSYILFWLGIESGRINCKRKFISSINKKVIFNCFDQDYIHNRLGRLTALLDFYISVKLQH
jgi:hypothetical protein